MAYCIYQCFCILLVTKQIVTQNTDGRNTVSEGYISSLQLKIKASKWVSYAGCGYWQLNRHDTQSKVQEIFRNYTDGESSNFITDDIDKCALKCSSIAKMKYFSYYKTVCHCAFDISVKAELINPLCKKKCSKPYKRYCGSGIGSMVFEFRGGIEEEMPKYVSSIKSNGSVLDDWYCLTGQNEQYKNMKYCEKSLKSTPSCKEKDILVVLKNEKFVQWKCNITRNFRVIQRTWTEEITSRTVTETTGDFKNDTIPFTEKSTSDFLRVMIVLNGCLFIAILLILLANYIVFKRASKSRKIPEVPPRHMNDEHEIETIPVAPNYDAIESGVNSRSIQISNQIYGESQQC